jgi:ATP-dependent helicase/nuclease subunit B
MPRIEDKIKIIPIESPFLRVLAEHVKEKFESNSPDFSRILMVFPSQRNKFYFRRYLLEEVHCEGIIPPAMKTIDELIAFAYEQTGGSRGRMLDSLERNFLLKNIIDLLKIGMWRDLPFLRFVSIGERLLNFFDELARERVTIADLQGVSALGHYPEKYIEEELPILGKIYEEYRKALAASGASDNVDVNDSVYEKFSADILSGFDFTIIAGLAGLTAVESKIVGTILSDIPSEFILHSCSPDELNKAADVHDPFHVHYKLFQILNADPQAVATLGGHNTVHPVVHVRSLKSESQQTFHLQSVLQKVAKRYSELHRVGIVLADETILFSITESLKTLGIEYNLSAGLSFKQSSLYSFLAQLHELVNSDYHFEELFSFIRHPLMKNAVIDRQELRPLIYGLEKTMIDRQCNYFDTEEFVDSFGPLVSFIKRCCDAVNAELEFSEYLSGAVALLNDLLSYNQEVVKRSAPDIKEFLDRLHDLSALRVPEKYLPQGKEMLEFLLRVLESGRYHIQGDPMRGVQIIGVLEARNLDFDCVIIPSMNENIFPRHSEKDMFVNQALRRAVNLPHSQERENLFYYYFTELKEGKKEVHISYVAEEDKDIASRFIMLALPGMRHDDAVTRLQQCAFALPERSVEKSSDLLKIIYGKLQRRGLSPTALSMYRACPYQYYLRYVLDVAEPAEIVEEPGALEWGSIIHAALQHFYSRHFPRGFKQSDMDRATSLLEMEFDKAIGSNKGLARKPRAVTYLDAEIYKRYLRSFLAVELERFNLGFEIAREALEHIEKHYVTVNSTPIRLTGIPDRIDTLDKKYYVIDYKTGSLPKNKELEIGDDFLAFQLPMYAVIFSRGNFDAIGGMLYYKIDEASRTRDIVEGMNVTSYLTDFQDKILIPTIKKILDPDVAFHQSDDPESCKHCTYKQVCGEIDE